MYRLAIYSLVIVLTISLTLADNKFPNDPQPCHYGDIECIEHIIQYFLTEKIQGDSAINLISINPLRVSKIQIHQGEESPVNIDLVFSNNEIVGVHHPLHVKVKGFGKNLTEKHEVTFKFAEISLYGDYTINGKVLILPISGMGKSNITLYEPVLKMRFTGQPMEKDGQVYMHAHHMKCSIEPQNMHFYFENLFNGDKALGDNMNKFLNENWRDIYGEVRQSLQLALAQIFESVINNVFAKYPYAKYFLE